MRLPDELYATFVRSLPIVCVDLLVTDDTGAVLLVRRLNQPAANEWWFPGGRVLIGERREAAVRRKLTEECALRARTTRELGTFDLILPLPDGGLSHSVTTVFHVRAEPGPVLLDSQSSEYAWRAPADWRRSIQVDFIARILDGYAQHPG